MDAFKSDIANSSISKKHKVFEANDLAELNNSELRHVLDNMPVRSIVYSWIARCKARKTTV